MWSLFNKNINIERKKGKIDSLFGYKEHSI